MTTSSAPWIDISAPLRHGMVHWPGDPDVTIERREEMARGSDVNVSTLSLGAHTGTHMDAPIHFLPDEPGIDAMPLGATVGQARVVEIRDPRAVTAEELLRHDPGPGERLLFRTANSRRGWVTDAEFVEDYVYISSEAARYLASRRIMTVGIDYLSVGGYHVDGAETHRILLQAGIWIIEGLDLSLVEPGNYELVCLPLRIVDGDGAPARAVLRPAG